MDSLGRSLLGLSFGSAADLWELTKGNIDESIAGKDTHFGAESLRFARGHLPLVNLWYAKAALDHMGLFALQENLSPATCRGSRTRPAMTGIRNISGAPMRPRRAGRRALLKWLVVSDAATRPNRAPSRPKRKAR